MAQYMTDKEILNLFHVFSDEETDNNALEDNIDFNSSDDDDEVMN